MPAILSRLSILFITRYHVTLTTQNAFKQAFRSVHGCQTCMCKCSINFAMNGANGLDTSAERSVVLVLASESAIYCRVV